MRYRYDLHNLGREIEESVRGAIKPEDIQHLKGSIDEIVNELTQMGREFTQSGTAIPPPPPRPSRRPEHRPQHQRHTAVQYGGAPVPASVKSVDGIVLTVLGTVFAGLTTVMGIVFAALYATGQVLFSAALGPVALTFGWLLGLGATGSAFLLAKGSSLRRRAKRYSEYLRLFGGCKMYPLEQLSIITDKSKAFIARDLRRMIDSGKLPNAHLDADKSCIILDEETYSQYLLAEQKSRALSKKNRKQKAVAAPKESAPALAPEPSATASPVDTIILEGRAYIDRINTANRFIKGEAVSQKIAQLEGTVSKIFDYVSEHPEKQGDLRRLMSYYLPTTLKLLEAYGKFEAHAVRGENVSTAMHEIEGALDTINLAFENLLDDLFEHEMYDITSDISALETMLAQEGLTAQDFAATNENNAAGGIQ
ncbi:MAG: 5-bromo-4-chloroindolyl phosphate hydrolysis family protein [Angelakisella sp.]